MAYYYHINKNASPEWTVGAKFVFGQEPNFLWNTFQNNDSLFTLPNNITVTYDKLIQHALSVYQKKEAPSLNNYHYNSINTLEEALNCLYNTLRNCREVIFEQIRKESFANLPSRKTCIWLMPEDPAALNFWKSTLNGQNVKAFRVKTEGNIHQASQKWLAGGTYSLSTWESNANNYWKGIGSGNGDDEFLFEGQIEVVEEL